MSIKLTLRYYIKQGGSNERTKIKTELLGIQKMWQATGRTQC